MELTGVMVNSKPVSFFATCAVANVYSPLELLSVFDAIVPIFKTHGYDFYSLVANTEDTAKLKANGYNLFAENQSYPDETGKELVVKFTMHDEKIWIKIDDYGDSYVATMLYPEDY